jgi:SAM-dependent methyltransferase
MADLCDGFAPAVDVGAGPGLDARRIGAVAFDASRTMARRGREYGVPYAVGDAVHLPIPTGAAGCCRCDRVLQHLDDPRRGVLEMTRCLRPGGRLVICDPDQQTLTIAVPGLPDELVERVRRLRRDVGYRNGTYVSALPGWLVALGFTGLTVDAFPLVLHDPDDAFGIAGWPRYWADRHGFTPAEGEQWDRGVGSARHRGFLYAVTYFVVSATRA